MFVPKGPIDNKSALVQVIAWYRKRQQAIAWSNRDIVKWRMYAALGGDETIVYVHQQPIM